MTEQGLLAQTLQDLFTVTDRLRSGRRAPSDAASFRTELKGQIARAHETATTAGYSSSEVREALYALVVFIDETILNSGLAAFSDWARQPLQEELWQDHMGGERFFETLDEMLRRPESQALTETLEVYELCLLLGFHGRYRENDPALAQYVRSVSERIRRSRRSSGELVPGGGLPTGERLPRFRDPWRRRLAVAAITTASVAVLLLAIFGLSLRGAVGDVQRLETSQRPAEIR